MSLGSALVDRGHQIRQASTPERVEGSTVFKDEEGPEFKCRLDISSTPERTKDGMTSVDSRPKLITGKKDVDGNILEWRIGDRVKVVSRELGEDVWEVDDDPEPIRKKRPVIGWELTIHRVKES